MLAKDTASFINRQPLPLHYSPNAIVGRASDMRFAIERPLLDQNGATVIEYALVAFFVSIAAFSVLVSIGTSVSGIFSKITTSF
jgi:Flp pilus assembly pilin Flp